MPVNKCLTILLKRYIFIVLAWRNGSLKAVSQPRVMAQSKRSGSSSTGKPSASVCLAQFKNQLDSKRGRHSYSISGNGDLNAVSAPCRHVKS